MAFQQKELHCPEYHPVEAHFCASGQADCGCNFHQNSDGPDVWELCPLHEAASRLADALKPFARLGWAIGKGTGAYSRDVDEIYAFNGIAITLGDLRRAAVLLEEAGVSASD